MLQRVQTHNASGRATTFMAPGHRNTRRMVETQVWRARASDVGAKVSLTLSVTVCHKSVDCLGCCAVVERLASVRPNPRCTSASIWRERCVLLASAWAGVDHHES